MKRVMVIAGEASADLHAGKMIQAVHRLDPDITFFGIGGVTMRKAGFNALVDSKDLAVVGLVEVLAHRKVIFGALDRMREILQTDPPDLLVLIDYPDFNLRLARTAKEVGVKVLYYIGPQVWAWRQKRVHTIRERVDMMAVVFPFEETFYKRFDVPVEFVGHPLTDELETAADLPALKLEFGLDPGKRTVGLFPGSRHSEIKRLLPIILESANRLYQSRQDIQFILPVASTLSQADIQPALSKYNFPVTIIESRSHEVIQTCDVIVTVSGTVTLEIALYGIPQVIINKVSWLTYAIVSRMLKIPYIGLCNIVADAQVTPELIQHKATPENITREINKLLDDNAHYQTVKAGLGTIKARLGAGGGINNIARLLVKMLG
ncbi:MAG: lipid-A-disaccharide synthase [Gammaproteobacteria bacterium]|nr:lipid-A-disaccharide synthase [Gammaproteobacteria bacterium]MDH5652830.1 lipid-A-disaccharide synthase [Gammaproteobacteria bacterium]